MEISHYPLFDESQPVNVALDEVTLDDLRRAFSGLFDRAVRAVQAAGFDQDDVELERWLLCRLPDGTACSVRVDVLSDLQRFLQSTLTGLQSTTGRKWNVAEVQLLGLRVVAILERPAETRRPSP